MWPADWLCDAPVFREVASTLLTRPRSQRSRNDEELGAEGALKLAWQRPNLRR
jgi:hypothetical protein